MATDVTLPRPGWMDERMDCTGLGISQYTLLTSSQDPCGMMYDPTEELYHVMYQFHPEHIDWGT